ncbi:phytochrome A, partial [Tanacetum coccineum]
DSEISTDCLDSGQSLGNWSIRNHEILLITRVRCSLALDEKTFKVLAYSENALEMLTTVSYTVPNVGQTPVLGIGTDVRTIFAGPSATALFKALGFGEVSLLNLILVHCKTSGKPFYAIVHRVTAKAMGRLQSLPSGSID